jgi:hypothetical protein
MEVTGLLERRRVFAGSKSERDAVVLTTADRSFIVRRTEGNPFRDEVLDSLVGRKVHCVGTLLMGGTFQADSVTPLG